MALKRTLAGGWRGLRANPITGRSTAAPAPRSRLLSTFHPAKNEQHSRQRAAFRRFVPALVVASALAVTFISQDTAHAEAPAVNLIRLTEVKQHGKDAERKWIIRGTQVYDITDWIPGHPGGDVVSPELFPAAQTSLLPEAPARHSTSLGCCCSCSSLLLLFLPWALRD